MKDVRQILNQFFFFDELRNDKTWRSSFTVVAWMVGTPLVLGSFDLQHPAKNVEKHTSSYCYTNRPSRLALPCRPQRLPERLLWVESSSKTTKKSAFQGAFLPPISRSYRDFWNLLPVFNVVARTIWATKNLISKKSIVRWRSRPSFQEQLVDTTSTFLFFQWQNWKSSSTSQPTKVEGRVQLVVLKRLHQLSLLLLLAHFFVYSSGLPGIEAAHRFLVENAVFRVQVTCINALKNARS